MINSISQLLPQQGAGATAPATVRENSPVAAMSGNTFPDGNDSPPVEVLVDAVDQLNQHAQAVQRSLSFSIDDNSGRTVVQVVDTQTDEVIRQIPSEEMLVLIRNFSESIGNIFDEVV